MDDRPRLVIGSTIIDSVEDAGESLSSIPGTFFGWEDDGSGLIISTGPTELTGSFVIIVNADNQSDLLDRYEDVIAALDDMKAEGLIIEADVGVTKQEIDLATVDSFGVDTSVEWGDLTAWVRVSLSAELIDASLFGKTRWQYQRNSAGRGFISGALMHPTRAQAVAAAAALAAAPPVWMPAEARLLTDLNEFGASSGDPSTLLDTSYKPGDISLVWECMASWMHSNSAFAGAKRAEFRFKSRLEGPLNQRAGNLPGMSVTITGMVEWKTENSTTYDVSDTTATIIDDSALKGRMVAIVAAAIARAERRLGTTITQLNPIEDAVTGEDGVFEVLVEGITGGDSQVIEWDERETYSEEFRGKIVALADGSDWEFEHPGDDLVTVRHELRVVALNGSRGYPQPQSIASFSDWRRTMLEDDPAQTFRAGEGLPRRVEKIYRRSYVRVNRKPVVGGSRITRSDG